MVYNCDDYNLIYVGIPYMHLECDETYEKRRIFRGRKLPAFGKKRE
jgi:hypothetical protein